MKNVKVNIWVIIYSITALVLAASVFVLYRLWPFWGDISGFITEAPVPDPGTGIRTCDDLLWGPGP